MTDYYLCYFHSLENSRQNYFRMSILDIKYRRCAVLKKLFFISVFVLQIEVEYSFSFWFICFYRQKVAAVYIGTELGPLGYYYSLKKKSRKSAGIAVFLIYNRLQGEGKIHLWTLTRFFWRRILIFVSNVI